MYEAVVRKSDGVVQWLHSHTGKLEAPEGYVVVDLTENEFLPMLDSIRNGVGYYLTQRGVFKAQEELAVGYEVKGLLVAFTWKTSRKVAFKVNGIESASTDGADVELAGPGIVELEITDPRYINKSYRVEVEG